VTSGFELARAGFEPFRVAWLPQRDPGSLTLDSHEVSRHGPRWVAAQNRRGQLEIVWSRLRRAEFFALPTLGFVRVAYLVTSAILCFFRNILLQFRPENLYTGERKVF
jgi:hypothetical protein